MEHSLIKRLENVDRELHSIIDDLKTRKPTKAELEGLRKKLNSKEEQDFIKWSVELGRKAKKESWKRLLSELSPEEKAELLK